MLPFPRGFRVHMLTVVGVSESVFEMGTSSSSNSVHRKVWSFGEEKKTPKRLSKDNCAGRSKEVLLMSRRRVRRANKQPLRHAAQQTRAADRKAAARVHYQPRARRTCPRGVHEANLHGEAGRQLLLWCGCHGAVNAERGRPTTAAVVWPPWRCECRERPHRQLLLWCGRHGAVNAERGRPTFIRRRVCLEAPSCSHRTRS